MLGVFFRPPLFVVPCYTRASRRSKWVKQEKEMELVKQVTKRPRQRVVVMNLERDLQTELHRPDRLSNRATAFLSYARPGRKIAERSRRALQNHVDAIRFDSAGRPGQDWSSVLHSAMDGAVARGFVPVPVRGTGSGALTARVVACIFPSMSTLAEVEAAVATFSPEELAELELFVRMTKKAKSAKGRHSVMDIKPSHLGKMLRPLGTREEWYDEMLEGRV